MEPLRAIEPNDFVGEVHDGLVRLLASEPGNLGEAGRRLACAPGAKRIRPRLVELLGRAVGAPHAALLDIAIAAELVHAASLLHDDVIDRADERRGLPSANASYGNVVAVLAGDLVLSTSLVHLQRHPRIIELEALDTIRAMTRAAAYEAAARGRTDLGIDAWREVAVGKTGMLFRWCARAAALLAGDTAAATRFGEYGLGLGIAFQIADDLLDFADAPTGKPRFADLRSRTPSFAILCAAERSRDFADELGALWSVEQPEELGVARVAARLRETGALEVCADRLSSELDDAERALGAWAQRRELVELMAHARELRRRAREGGRT